MGGRDDAGGGTGLDHEDRFATGFGKGEDAATALHQQELGIETFALQSVLDAFEIARHHRPDAGVDDRSAGAVELAKFRRHLRGQRQHGLGEDLSYDGAQLLFVSRIDVGVQEADGDRLDLFLLQPPCDI